MPDMTVVSSPHLHARGSTRRIMLDVIIALCPAVFAAVYFQGGYTLLLILAAVVSAMAGEALIQAIFKRPLSLGDLSAVVTGILIAFNLPPTAPVWMPVIGGLFAMIVVKGCFGGLGHNFINPALAARAVLMASWPVRMTAFTVPGALDAATGATPLALMKSGATDQLPSLWDMFAGNIGGCLGEISALALLIGAAYLLIRKVIDWRIPVCFIATVALMAWIFAGADMVLPHLLTGGLMLGAFFMATDYVTSPVTLWGRVIMGVGCGLITSVIRLFGGYPEGVSYSILLMNCVTPLIERVTRPRLYGEVKRHA